MMTIRITDDRFPVSPALVVGAITVGALAWLAAILVIPDVRFVVLAPTAKAGVDIILALSSLFGALVLWLFPTEGSRLRLRWLATGFLVLGLGSLVFGYLQPLVADTPDLNRSRYISLLMQTAASACFSVGLCPAAPRRVSPRVLAGLIIGVMTVGLVLYDQADRLPRFIHVVDVDDAAGRGVAIMEGLTRWHWVVSVVPLLLAMAAVFGAIRRHHDEGLGLWLVAAMALLVGAQLHALFWPSGYGPILTTATLLRLGFILLVLVGGVRELRHIAAERARLLAAEQTHAQRLRQLALLRADFTAMVAHELSGPIAAIRRFTEIAASGEVAPHVRPVLAAMDQELDLLTALVRDVQASATVERDDFRVTLQPVPLGQLLDDALAYGQSLPGEHAVVIPDDVAFTVWADQERITQVLRNLLSNAAKYSPPGTRIEIRVACRDHHVEIAVVDQGYGIHPDDLDRVLEKFGRGRDLSGRRVSGVGLGLYLSRRIVHAHGSDLTIRSTPGVGTAVAFTLPVDQPVASVARNDPDRS
jgi:signal transduction histidine kinase